MPTFINCTVIYLVSMCIYLCIVYNFGLCQKEITYIYKKKIIIIIILLQQKDLSLQNKLKHLDLSCDRSQDFVNGSYNLDLGFFGLFWRRKNNLIAELMQD